MLARPVAVIMISLLLAGCAVLSPLPKKSSVDQRLAMFPTKGLPLEKPVKVYWDEYKVPWIEAQTDDDAAFTLGLVHAHLRLGQLEFLRRISQGRISEMAGPLATDIDHSLRIINFGRAAAETEKSLPPETKRWMERFVAGINHYQKTAKTLPAEYRILGLEREPWTIRDILTIGRLASTDVNWLVWFRLLQLRERKDWPRIWARLLKTGGDSLASFKSDGQREALDEIIRGMSKSGSNSLAIAASRSTNGAALLANDPHLGITLPNIWLLAGIKSPSYHAVGLMVPGLPFVALGRNPWIAWGGTNMRSASSDIYDVSKLPKGAITTRKETVKVRWWFDRTIAVRETKLGPVISDAPLLKTGGKTPLALRWIGHRPSDEVTAFLKVMKARNFTQFRAAFATFSVSAQNMLYADIHGNIGQVMAVHLPLRKRRTPRDLVLDPTRDSDKWHGILTVRELPISYNPREGFLASANNKPSPIKVPVGYFFSTDDRIARMTTLMNGKKKVGVADLKAVQRDVYLISAVKLRDVFVEKLESLGVAKSASPAEKTFIKALKDWDGHYRTESRGAVAFELFHHSFGERFRKRIYAPALAAVVANQARNKAVLGSDIRSAEPKALAADLKAALADAAKKFGGYKNWGEMHRLTLGHPLRMAPVIGGRYQFINLPVAGSNDTLMKTAHSITDTRHDTRYGSNARHISDMSHPDKNYFTLLGGQDGWFNAPNFIDQVPLWQKGEYVQVPLQLETVRKTAKHTMELGPGK